MTNLPNNLPTILRSHGLKVVEIDGWQDRGRPASTGGFNPVGVLCHHTASADNGRAAIPLLVQGRSDLAGPLCQLSLDRQGIVYIVAAGRANHAGVAKASGTVSGGDGNTLYIGIEAQNLGTGEHWPKAQYDAYVLLAAVLSVEITGNSAQTVRAHKETSITGKIDPAGPTPYEPTFDMDKFRLRVAAQMKAITQKPKPPVKSGAPIRVVHASGKASKPAATAAQMTAALDTYAAEADVITLTEVAGLEMIAALVAWAADNKWHLFHPPYAGQRECAILSRAPITAAKAQRLTDLTLKVGRKSPMFLISAHVKGGPWVGVWHAPAHNEGLKPGLWPTRVYRSALAGLRAARMKTRGGGVVICGDWNIRPALINRVNPFKHLKWAGAVGQKPTEGGRVIDGALTNFAIATPAVTLPAAPGFDHRAVLVVLKKKERK
jgi:endonuclease/exonuclease/phosphatase (EEP) superfamily protein YafD